MYLLQKQHKYYGKASTHGAGVKTPALRGTSLCKALLMVGTNWVWSKLRAQRKFNRTITPYSIFI